MRLRIAVLATMLTCLAGVLSGCGGGAASPTKVAQMAGATSCDNSGYFVQSKLTNKKDVVYDCRFAHRLPECVTYSGNIASNATSEVQFLFSDALNASRPPCLREHKEAAARLAAKRAAAALARKRTDYNQTMAADRATGWHKGYTAWNGNPVTYQAPSIYWKWVPGNYSCPSYDSDLGYPCWKVDVVTRNGCDDLGIELGEYAGGSNSSPQIGSIDGDSGAVVPEVPSVIEVDGDKKSAQFASVASISCY